MITSSQRRLSIILMVCSGVLLISYSAAAQGPPRGSWGDAKKKLITGKISGVVMSEATNDPVDYATVAVMLAGTDKIISGEVTNEKGSFKLSEVKIGKYDLHISFLGYEDLAIKDIELTPKKPDMDLGKLFLKSDQVLLEEVEVVEEAALIESRVDRIVYNAEKDITSMAGDASDILRKVPMLSVDLEGNVSLRGSQNIQILINNRPSGMFAADAAEALRMLPADQIKAVEVITSPSARYDAEGTGGIINIITKKKNIQGISATTNLSLGILHNRESLNVAIGKGRLGANLGGGITYSWPATGTTEFYRKDQFEDFTRTLTQNGINRSSRLGFNGNGNIFYEFNAYNSINSSFSTRGMSFDSENILNSVYRDPDGSLEEIYKLSNTGDRTWSGYDWTTDYTKKFQKEGQELVIAFQLNGNISDQETLYKQVSEQDYLNFEEFSLNDGDNKEYTIQTDYVHPFGDLFKMELGGKSVLRRIDSDFSYLVYDDESGDFSIDPTRTDLFMYQQDVYAGYLSFTIIPTEKLSILAGSRYEHTSIQGSFRDSDNPFSTDYSNLVPSIIATYKLKGMNSVKLAYNQRIQRPSLRFVNPFITTEDSRNIRYGNPYLAPEISHTIEAGYSWFINRSVINASLYYRHTNDEINPVLQINEEGISETTYENIGTSDNLGVSMFGSIKLFKKLDVRGSVDFNWFAINGPDDRDDLSNSGIQYKLRLNGSYKFNKGYAAEFFGFFNSPRRSLQGNNPSFSMFNVGFMKEFKNKRGSVGIRFTNPFRKYLSFETELSGPDFYQYRDYARPFRSAAATFRYQFGKLDFKAKTSRSKIRNNDLKSGNDNNQN